MDNGKIIQIGNLFPDTEGFENRTAGRVYNPNGLCPTIRTPSGGGITPMVGNLYRIRKLTPRECFRLMSVSEENIDKIQASGISNSQQYKLAGNSIDVNVLKAIFRQLFKFNQTQQTY